MQIDRMPARLPAWPALSRLQRRECEGKFRRKRRRNAAKDRNRSGLVVDAHMIPAAARDPVMMLMFRTRSTVAVPTPACAAMSLKAGLRISCCRMTDSP
ncbi:hypothetical protein [Paracoccus lichenicola]|uniref:hypothetical protein n=1 Tax=Paracoccus lichenicola TaxID=2665644 RepID=UPI001E47AE2A|nr:hypothetical protein [Paracoccus lichenicola]